MYESKKLDINSKAYCLTCNSDLLLLLNNKTSVRKEISCFIEESMKPLYVPGYPLILGGTEGHVQ